MSTVTSDDAAPTRGFPSFTDYLPIGKWHPTAVYWPAAQNRLELFFAARDRANDKLFAAFTARLPCVLGNWWIRSWADEFLWRTAEGIHASVADVRALYDFGRKLDGQLQLTGTPPGNKHPRDAEFTYYVNPFLQGKPDGTAVPEPFATFRIDYRVTDQNSQTRFPRMRVLDPPTRVWLGCHEFVEWGAFLASPDALTPQQMGELGHIAYSESGTDGWCESQGTHGEQCGSLAKRILSRLRDAMVVLSDSLRIAVVTVPQSLLFADALALVSQWLEPAEAKAGGKGGAEAVAIAAKEVPKGEGGTPLADEFAKLRRFARDELEGDERKVLEAICESNGRLALSDIKTLCKWQEPIESSWNSLRTRLNTKLKSQGFSLGTTDRSARLNPVPGSARK